MRETLFDDLLSVVKAAPPMGRHDLIGDICTAIASRLSCELAEHSKTGNWKRCLVLCATGSGDRLQVIDVRLEEWIGDLLGRLQYLQRCPQLVAAMKRTSDGLVVDIYLVRKETTATADMRARIMIDRNGVPICDHARLPARAMIQLLAIWACVSGEYRFTRNAIAYTIALGRQLSPREAWGT